MKNFYITFGIWIAVLPYLGIPGVWRNALISLSGIFLILIALGPAILKLLKPKSKGRPRKKTEEGEGENGSVKNRED